MNDRDILSIIKDDAYMMDVLRIARILDLPDWMIGAGFVRNKIWDYLHGFNKEEVDTSDIDLIFYDPTDLSWDIETKYDNALKEKLNVNWSTKNQARMHERHGKTEPYKNSEDALTEWVETPTCVAVKLEDDDSLTLIAPHGISDLVGLIVRPTPTHLDRLDVFWERVKSKKWEEKWPKLTVIES